MVADQVVENKIEKRGIWRRLVWVAGTTIVLLFCFYLSLLLTSEDLDLKRREVVSSAIAVLAQKGFDKPVFVLNHLVKFRASDNWWNGYVGHHDAYAATNFPFEVVTLYPEFFTVAVDDNERAAILLHESYHLLGSGEEAALEGAWKEKRRLGWTENQYGQTKVWNNTRQLTMTLVPRLFQCGTDGKSDCVP
ncbi:MAG: hypothetical protein ABR501_10065 [Pyrinomonadaceae bacterium]